MKRFSESPESTCRASLPIRLTVALAAVVVVCAIAIGGYWYLNQWRAWSYASDGYDALLREEYEKAVGLFEQSLRLNDTDSRAWFNLGIAHASLNQLEEAIEAYSQAAELDPHEPSYEAAKLAMQAYAALHRSEYIRSEQLYRQALEETKTPDVLHQFGYVLRQVAKHEEAIKVLHEALLLDPDNTEIAMNLGHAYSMAAHKSFVNRDYQRSVELNRDALRYVPDEPYVWHELGLSLRASDRPEEAVEALSRALELDPENLIFRRTLEEFDAAMSKQSP